MVETFKEIFKDINWTFGSKIGNALFNGLFIILLARALGVESFGMYVGILSFINLLLPFLGLGSDALLIKYISTGEGDVFKHLKRLFLYYLGSGLFIGICLTGINAWFFELPFLLLLLAGFILGEAFFRFGYVTGKLFQGMGNLKRASVAWTSVAAVKFFVVLVFWLTGGREIETWCVWYAYSGFIWAAVIWSISLIFIYRNYSAKAGNQESGITVKEGLPFSFSEVLEKTYADADKFLLLKMASSQAAGIYGGAYQFIKLVTIPVRSLLSTVYADFFIKGAKGFIQNYTFMKKVLPFLLAASGLLSVLLYAGAPLLPVILGEGYAEAVDIVRWLAVVPVLQSIYMVQADAFSGSNYQNLRVKIQGIAVVFNVLANLALIPEYGWKGAVIATLSAELLMVMLFSFTSFRLKKSLLT